MDMLEQNKKNAIAFFKTAFQGDPAKAAGKYTGPFLIQHNPMVGEGIRHFIDYFDNLHKKYPRKSIEFIRSIAEGDLVVLHTHQQWSPGEEYAAMDIFRFNDDGKIIEHWETMQKIPDESANKNTMF